MIRDICKDEAFLARNAEPATPEDIPIAADLLETLKHHKDGCVGMAANMIGINRRIIAFDNEGTYMVMSTRRSSKSPSPTIRRRAVSLWKAPVRPGGGGPSRYAGRMRNFRSG